MLPGLGNAFNFRFSNQNNPSTTAYGTSVTPGASNVEGAWQQVASAANISEDIYCLVVRVTDHNTTAVQFDGLLDVGVDPAGGTSYTAIISNVLCGQADASSQDGIIFIFPIKIKAGSTIAVRIQGSNATPGTALVRITAYGKPTRPDAVMAGAYAETVGAITGSGGVGFTPGNSNAEGAWQSLGTTAKDLWWWQLAVQISNGTTTNLLYHIDLAYGDATNKHEIITNAFLSVPGTAERIIYVANVANLPECFRHVPAGSEIFVRGTCSGTANTGFNAVAIGIGG
jgi:hypothetical protein